MYCLCLVLIFVLLSIYRLGIFHANHLCVLIQIRIKGNVGTVKHVQYFYWQFEAAASIVDLFLLLLLFMFHVHLYYDVLSVPCSHVITCWKRADLLAPFMCCVFLCFCHFPISCPRLGMSGVTLDYIDS